MNLAKSLGIPHQKIDISPIIRDVGAYDIMSHNKASNRTAIEQVTECARIITEKE